ncbi:MAG: ABC transporter permease [Anaerolineales bacterium]|jgi:ABC-2 type transport system permease protein
MKKVWLIARTTFWRQVRSGTFLLFTFGLPVIMVVAGAVPILRETRATLPTVGIVDPSGQIEFHAKFEHSGQTLSLEQFSSLDSAKEAYSSDRIEAYLVIPEGYTRGERPVLYSSGTPSETLQDMLQAYLRQAIHQDQPDWLLDRFEDPADFTYTSLESGASVSEGPGLLLRVVTPVALGLLFAFSVFTGANQLGAVIIREKDQRAMEMVITSIRPTVLIAGKVLGMTMVSMAQLGFWTLGAVIGLGLAFSGPLAFSTSMIHVEAIFWAVLLGVPGYFLYATIASGLGIIAGDQQHARQLSGMLGFVGMTPLYFAGIIVGAPNSVLAIALTLFPLTAPTFGLMRMTLTSVPVWQLGAAFGILVLCLLVGIWAVARVFRTAMLLYGQRLTATEIWDAVRRSR